MRKEKYKIWIEIEKVNYEDNIYEDMSIPHSAGEFDTLEEAKAHGSKLIGCGWDE